MIFKKRFECDKEKCELLAEKFHVSAPIMEIILSRGMSSEAEIEQFLNPTKLYDPFLLDGMRALCDRLSLAKMMGDKVLIFGDYDVDGVSAVAIMLKALSQFGISAQWYLPNRFVDGYGLTKEVIAKVNDKFAPDLIITVDCGITAHDEVEYAKTLGIEVIVTDHHELPEVLPETVVITAKKAGYPFDGLCGTGVAYKIAEALLGSKEAEQFLPIAAIATIADIVPVLDENRVIVKRGMENVRSLPLGIRMLLREMSMPLERVSATEVAYKIAPRLNASGRMGDASDTLMLYIENDPAKLRPYIKKVLEHNSKRQDVCSKIFDECEKMLSKMEMKKLRVICLASKTWDRGVLGIICSKLVKKYHRPAFLFAQDGDTLYGSGRSIDDVNIHAILSHLSDILVTFGGHKMAAGLTLKADKFEEFASRMNTFMLCEVSDKAFIPIEYFDIVVKEEWLTPKFMREIEMLQPFGCDNPRPKLKICFADPQITPLERFPSHSEIKSGSLELIQFGAVNTSLRARFSRRKNYIFEFQEGSSKGIVDFFDGGYAIEDAADLNAFSIDQLKYSGLTGASFESYQYKDLAGFVTDTTVNAFGTCFVCFSSYEYIHFTRTFDVSHIYHFGICEREALGFNTLILCPKGTQWAKNFDKIVFLSQPLDTGYIARLQRRTTAKIYVPRTLKQKTQHIEQLDLSHEVFGKIYKAMASKRIVDSQNIFDYFDRLKLDMSFCQFYAAFSVFEELGLVSASYSPCLNVNINRTEKKDLKNSKIFNAMNLIKNNYIEGLNWEK